MSTPHRSVWYDDGLLDPGEEWLARRNDVGLSDVYVPSRGRAGDCPTITELLRDGVRPVVVTPLAEAPEYDLYYPACTVIGVDVQGIGPTRQWILRHARQRGLDRVWMLDDDLDDPRYRAHYGAPYEFIPWNEWLAAVADLTPVAGGIGSIGIATGMTRQYGWPEDSAIPNKRAGYAVLLTVDGPWNYWPYLHEDTDMTLQVLTAGYKTIKLPQYVFHTTTMNWRGGGCQQDYEAGAGQRDGVALRDKWEVQYPGLVRLEQNKEGNTVTRIDWRRFRRNGTFVYAD